MTRKRFSGKPIVAFTNSTVFILDYYKLLFGLMFWPKGKVVLYNPLRLGTVIVLVSSGIDFVNTPRLYSDPPTKRDCQFGHCGLCQRKPKVLELYKKHTATQPLMPEMRLEPLNICLTDSRLNQLS